jgi:radical SAM superfamily enzyme YgiQ (UPF0313 family)
MQWDTLSPGPTYGIVTSRGCPHNCSYCYIDQLTSVYGRNPIRFRSVDHILGELEQAINQFEFFKYIGFIDDDFFLRPTKTLQELAIQYKERIGLPFWAMTSSSTFKMDKLEILLDAGLQTLQIGVQSGSPRILTEIYHIETPLEKTKEVINQIEPYIENEGLELQLHFILDNPYETGDDIIKSYKFITDLHPDITLGFFKASFFPGSTLYNRCVQDGLIDPGERQSYRDFFGKDNLYQNNYESLCLLFAKSGISKRLPRFVMSFLGSRLMRAFGSLLPESWYASMISSYPPAKLQTITKRVLDLVH